VNIADEDGNTPLHWASSHGYVYSTEKLLRNGADPNKKNNVGSTALLKVASTNDQYVVEEIMDLLIEYGADINIVDLSGDTPLNHASVGGVVCAARKLLRNKADPNQKNNKGVTAL
ncbi:hypothetical protein CAPTEDRAFT_87613, partial [Capitella teleta]